MKNKFTLIAGTILLLEHPLLSQAQGVTAESLSQPSALVSHGIASFDVPLFDIPLFDIPLCSGLSSTGLASCLAVELGNIVDQDGELTRHLTFSAYSIAGSGLESKLSVYDGLNAQVFIGMDKMTVICPVYGLEQAGSVPLSRVEPEAFYENDFGSYDFVPLWVTDKHRKQAVLTPEIFQEVGEILSQLQSNLFNADNRAGTYQLVSIKPQMDSSGNSVYVARFMYICMNFVLAWPAYLFEMFNGMIKHPGGEDKSKEDNKGDNKAEESNKEQKKPDDSKQQKSAKASEKREPTRVLTPPPPPPPGDENSDKKKKPAVISSKNEEIDETLFPEEANFDQHPVIEYAMIHSTPADYQEIIALLNELETSFGISEPAAGYDEPDHGNAFGMKQQAKQIARRIAYLMKTYNQQKNTSASNQDVASSLISKLMKFQSQLLTQVAQQEQQFIKQKLESIDPKDEGKIAAFIAKTWVQQITEQIELQQENLQQMLIELETELETELENTSEWVPIEGDTEVDAATANVISLHPTSSLKYSMLQLLKHIYKASLSNLST